MLEDYSQNERGAFRQRNNKILNNRVPGTIKLFLKTKFSQGMDENPRLLAVDEIAVKKRHRYLTVILNWETGQVIFVGEGRKYETLKAGFDSLSEEQKHSIEAIAMDT